MIKFVCFIGLLIALGFDESRATSKHTTAECTAIDYNIFPCAPYLIVAGHRSTPTRECCDGFMKMMLVSASCICSVLVEAKKSGFHINITRVEALPESCGVPLSPVISKCKVALAPAHNPAPKSSLPLALPSPTSTTPSPTAPSSSSAVPPICLLYTAIAFINLL